MHVAVALFAGVVVAVRADHLQGIGNHQRHIDRRDRVHVDRSER